MYLLGKNSTQEPNPLNTRKQAFLVIPTISKEYSCFNDYKVFCFLFFSRHTKIPGPFNPTDNTAHKNTRNAGRCTKFPQLELEGEMNGNPLGHKVPGCKRGSGLVLAELA